MTSTFMESPSSESKHSHTSSRSSRRKSPRLVSGRTAASVLSSDYLECHSSKNDLVRRLRKVVDSLSDEDIDTADYPGLASLAAVLVEDRYLLHRDKEVRLHTVLACMEVFYLYAPEPPYDEIEILKIFPQVIRQLNCLAVCTSPSQPNFQQYFKLLDQLAVVKTGVVLVEMTRTLESGSQPDNGHSDQSDRSTESGCDDEHTPTSEEALEVLTSLIQTLLRCVSIDHPSEVTSHATAAISACIEEFDGTIPIPILDEILMCISAGPVIWVTNPAFIEATAAVANKNRRLKTKNAKQTKAKLPPRTIQQTNQSYMVAASIIKRTEDRISTPTASLLNGILNGETNIIEQTNILSSDTSTTTTTTPCSTSTSNTQTTSDHKQITSSPADVWSIIYELHKITPQILTTVIGTVASSLRYPTAQKRLHVTKLLGRIFSSRTSDIAIKFHPCFVEWLKRDKDNDEEIRLVMVKYLVLFLGHKWKEEGLCEEVTDTLVKVIREDPCVDVRLAGIHQVCDLVHNQKESGFADTANVPVGGNAFHTKISNGALIPARLLKAVGNRVSSKNKIERRNSVTGLSHIYYRRYIMDKLKYVQRGGDDCDINVIMDAIHETCSFEISLESKSDKNGSLLTAGGDGNERYNFIPRLVFESAFFTDATDPDMRNRVIQIVDDVLLGTGNADSKRQEEVKKEPLTLTSRAVGLAIILNSLQIFDRKGTIVTDKSNAFRWMRSLLYQRAQLQHAVSSYVKARSTTERCAQGSEERMTADAAAIEKLDLVASLSAPPLQQSSPGSSSEDLRTILNKLHMAKDKHIFRLLASISLANHSPLARARVFDELPKRTNRLGQITASWIKSLARRLAMGNFINIDIFTHCILLAQEAFRERDFQVTMVFLNCVKIAVTIFPILGGNKECFGTLVELFSECRASHTSEVKKEIGRSDIITVLSGILAAAVSAHNVRISKAISSPQKSEEYDVELDPNLQSELVRLCTRDGTPQQARHAVLTLAALAKNDAIKTGCPIEEKEKKIFASVLNSLTSPSRLSISKKCKDNLRIICTLATLSAIVECAPSIFCIGTRCNKAICFILETVLLGQGQSDGESEEGKNDSESEVESNMGEACDDLDDRLSASRRRNSMKGLGTIGDNTKTLAISCRRACAALDFLVTYIRATIIYFNQSVQSENKSSDPLRKSCKEGIKIPSPQHITAVFNILINIIQNSGLPPSNIDRHYCKGTKERAALRENAGLNLLRLCDARLRLESKYLSTNMWHVLGSCFLDEEKVVRENIMNEFSMMLTGTGKYRDGRLGVAPSLRFLALASLCPDNDQHAIGNSLVNGNAANVGRTSIHIKSAALSCITSLRETCEATSVHCRALSRKAEKNFDNNLKMKLMPEFALPFAFHILSFRSETPSTMGPLGRPLGATEPNVQKQQEDNNDSEENFISEEGQHKMLQKRLRWLLEPLVQSLGDRADNISFLLRQAEIIGNKYRPINSSRFVHSSPSFSPCLNSPNTPSSGSLAQQATPIKSPESRNVFNSDEPSRLKLKVICASAREILLKLIKKDVNLTSYPGVMQIPSDLYSRILPLSADHKTESDKQKEAAAQGGIQKAPKGGKNVSSNTGRQLSYHKGKQKRDDKEASPKVRISPGSGERASKAEISDKPYLGLDEARENNTMSIGYDILQNEGKYLSPIPCSNSPSSTLSSTITVEKRLTKTETVTTVGSDILSESCSPNISSKVSITGKTSDNQKQRYTSSPPRGPVLLSKKRKGKGKRHETPRKRKSTPEPISMQGQKEEATTTGNRKSNKSNTTVSSNFDFIEEETMEDSFTIKVHQNKNSTRLQPKKKGKLTKRNKSMTPKKRRSPPVTTEKNKRIKKKSSVEQEILLKQKSVQSSLDSFTSRDSPQKSVRRSLRIQKR